MNQLQGRSTKGIKIKFLDLHGKQVLRLMCLRTKASDGDPNTPGTACRKAALKFLSCEAQQITKPLRTLIDTCRSTRFNLTT